MLQILFVDFKEAFDNTISRFVGGIFFLDRALFPCEIIKLLIKNISGALVYAKPEFYRHRDKERGRMDGKNRMINKMNGCKTGHLRSERKDYLWKMK